jgi:hypothetical protein
MFAAEVINKITITAEAAFDYMEALDLGELDRRSLKAEVEEYIDRMNDGGRLKVEHYFRCEYFDERSGRMLMLFLYRAGRMSVMQNWLLKGICFAEDWTEDAEEDGLIRSWLESRITDLADEPDWAVRVRAYRIITGTEKTLYENVAGEVRDEFECERDKNDAEKVLLLYSYYFKRQRGSGNNGKNAGDKKRARKLKRG